MQSMWIHSDYCTSCGNEEYLDFNTCKKCINNNCKTCSKEDDSIKCLSCLRNSKFIYLFNNSCLDECPQNYTPSEDNTTCIFKNQEDKNRKKNSKRNTLSVFLIIAFISSLLIIILFFFKRIYCRYKKLNESSKDKSSIELKTNSSSLIEKR